MKNTTTQERVEKQNSRATKIHSNRVRVLTLQNQGMTNADIADYMGISESSVRSLMYLDTQNKMIVKGLVELLKNSINKKGYTNISVGVEKYLGVSRTKLKEAVSKLEDIGYTQYVLKKDLLGIDIEKSIKLLTKPDLSYQEVCSLYEQYGL